ncbi:MAG: PQQ-dependent sugar dehydrogenase [Pseudopelagicola sp.]|nr:PQQ-dependent sugar dehydrogenase [Pseudopelagicola sp.]
MVVSQAAPPLRAETVADGFVEPWSFAFLPSGGMLVTERPGTLWHLTEDGRRTEIAGLPNIRARGQGGLLDVLVPRDFAQSREIFLSFSKPQRGGLGTAVFRAVLPDGRNRLEKGRVIFEMTPGSSGGRHFGSRIVEAPDGTLFVTIGERGDRPSAQDLTRHNGSVIRIHRDGTVPADNPFLDHPDAEPEIWSYGHRNPQGAALDPSGNLWVVEHGARGGDEVNRIQSGANYGWPVISYGRHYSGLKIGEGTHKAGMVQPDYYWDPSIAPSGMAFHTGKSMPDWRGAILVGSLKYDYIAVLKGNPLSEIAQIELLETERVRDVRQGPDGMIYFLSEPRGAIYRLQPGSDG